MKIEHIALYCIDLEQMRSFFTDLLGCVAGEMYHNKKLNFKSYFLTFPDNGCRLEIMTRPEIDKEQRNPLRAGLIHIAVALGTREAVDETTARIVAHGYECISFPHTTGDGYYESCIVGPEGLFVELTV